MIFSLLFIVFILWGLHLFKPYIAFFGALLGLTVSTIIGYHSTKIIELPLEYLHTLIIIIAIIGSVVGACLTFPFRKIFACINAGIYLGLFGMKIATILTLQNTTIIVFIVFSLIGFFITLRFYHYAIIVLMVITGFIIAILLQNIHLYSMISKINFLFYIKNYMTINPITILQATIGIYKQHIIYTIILLLGSSIYSILLQKNYVHNKTDTIHSKNKKILFRNIGYLFAIVLLINFIFDLLFLIFSFYGFSSYKFTFSNIIIDIYKIIKPIISSSAYNTKDLISPYITGVKIIHFPLVAMVLYFLLSLFKNKKTHISNLYSNPLLGILFAIVYSVTFIPLIYLIIQTIIAISSIFTFQYAVSINTFTQYFFNTIKNTVQFYTFFVHTPYNIYSLGNFIIISKWLFSGIIFPVLFYLFIFKHVKTLAYSSNINVTNVQKNQKQEAIENTTSLNTHSSQTMPQKNKQVPYSINNNIKKHLHHISSKKTNIQKKTNSLHYIASFIQKKYRQQKSLIQLIAKVFSEIDKVQEVIPNKYGIKGAQLFVRFKEGLPISHLQTKGILVAQVISYASRKQPINNILLIKEAIERSKASMGMIISTVHYSYQDLTFIKTEIQKLKQKLQKPIVLITGNNVARFVLKFGSDIFINN